MTLEFNISRFDNWIALVRTIGYSMQGWRKEFNERKYIQIPKKNYRWLKLVPIFLTYHTAVCIEAILQWRNREGIY